MKKLYFIGIVVLLLMSACQANHRSAKEEFIENLLSFYETNEQGLVGIESFIESSAGSQHRIITIDTTEGVLERRFENVENLTDIDWPDYEEYIDTEDIFYFRVYNKNEQSLVFNYEKQETPFYVKILWLNNKQAITKHLQSLDESRFWLEGNRVYFKPETDLDMMVLDISTLYDLNYFLETGAKSEEPIASYDVVYFEDDTLIAENTNEGSRITSKIFSTTTPPKVPEIP